MIGLPMNDRGCLYAISEVVQQLVDARDPVLVELAEQYPTTQLLIAYIRSLPQRDDHGARSDGPRVRACMPSQRLRFGAEDPNCVERAALFIGVEELHDSAPVRQLATIDTEAGLHTLPLVHGKAIILDPGLTGEEIELGLRLATPGPAELTPHQAIASTLALAKTEAAPVRNGPSTVLRARNSLHGLIGDGGARHLPDSSEIDGLGVMLALAERAAHRYGPRALAIVRTTARAVADLIDIATSQSQAQHHRNMRFQLGDRGFDTPDWLDRFALAVHHTGEGIGKVAGRAYLGYLGISPDLIDYFGKNLEAQGIPDPLKDPPKLATFDKLITKRSAA